MTTETMTSAFPLESVPKVGLERPVPGRLKLGSFKAWLIGLLGFTVMSIFAFHGYVAWVLANPPIATLTTDPMHAIGVPYKEVSFPSKTDNADILNGWYLPSESERTVVFSHGYGENREQSWVHVFDIVKALHEAHYNVLMFDYGFVHPGVAVTGGAREMGELLGAVDYVKENGARKVFVWGFSMGAGTALQAALHTKDIDGMILDSTFLLSPDSLYRNIRQHVDLPRFPSLPLIGFFLPLLTGIEMSDIPISQVLHKTYSMPLFMIHSKQDAKAPYTMAQDVIQNQLDNPLSKFWLVSGSPHEMIYRTHPKEYLGRTLQFLNRL